MAGLGHKTFTRERATVADVNGYLMDQTVMVFASSSARAAALPTPDPGMYSILLDGDGIPDRYIGGAWTPITQPKAVITSSASFAATAETRVTGSTNWQGTLRAGRLYQIDGEGLFTADTDGTVPELRWRGAAGAVSPTTSSTIICTARGYIHASARPQTFIARGFFGVNATGTHSISAFLRRFSVGGIPTVGPNDISLWGATIKDTGAYVTGYPKL